MAETMVDKKQLEQERLLLRGIAYADKFINKNYLVNLDMYPPVECPCDYRTYSGLRLFRLNKLVYDSSANQVEDRINDLMVSVYGALHSLQASALIVIDAYPGHVDFYIGTSSEVNASTAGLVLEKGLKGNFPGSKFSFLNHEQTVQLASRLESANGTDKSISSVVMVPSLRGESQRTYLQGIEKMIDALQGERYTALLVSEPLGQDAVEDRKRGFEQLYSTLSPFAQTSLAYGDNISSAVSDGSFTSFSDSINSAVSNTNSEGTSSTRGTTDGTSSGWSGGFSSGSGYSSNGYSNNQGYNYGFNSSTNHSTSESTGTSTSWARSVTSGKTTTTGSGDNHTETQTTGESRTLTITYEDKTVSGLMEQISEQLTRIKNNEIYGWWMTGAYFLADDVQTSVVAANTFRALIAGDQSYVDNAFINVWNAANNRHIPAVTKYLQCGMHPLITIPSSGQFDAQQVKPIQMISGKELPFFSGLPHDSVAGLMVDNVASFGREVLKIDDRRSGKEITIGRVLHKGLIEDNLVKLDLESFRSHCFVTGSTGSGKSNTVYCLIERFISNDIKFLVVEPAKGEYKHAFGGLKGINVFWTNPEKYPMLHINPFSFPENIHVLEHLDRLIEIFNACWPLRAAMPAILKNAVERIYIKSGWDLVRSIHFDNGKPKYPTFMDLLTELPILINESSYSSESKGDYIGALVTRVASLTNGIMGQVFCSSAEIEDEVFFDQNTIIDLSRVGAAETKSLIMGIMVMKLNEHRMATTDAENVPLKHVTILEEAHNLLRNTHGVSGGEGGNLASKSVEMISNSIAEMRTYGEGFVIVDQSPTAVDISAIKNTNTKIVMRLPEKTDQEMVGNSFSLDPDQIREISRLGTGMAVIGQNGWLRPVLTQIDAASNDYYYRDNTVINEAERRILIGKICAKVIEQAYEAEYKPSVLIALIRNSQLSEQKKKEYIRLVEGFIRRINNGSDNYAVHNFLIELMNCKGLFQVVPLSLTRDLEFSEKDTLIYKRWNREFRNKLAEYVTIDEEDVERELMMKLVVYQADVVRNRSFIKLHKRLTKKS